MTERPTSWADPPPIPVADPGLQPERTSMAWGRTSMAYLVAAAVTLRWVPYYGVAVVLVTGGLVLVALGIYAGQRRRYRQAALGILNDRLKASAGAVIALAFCTVALGLLSVYFVVTESL
ncbi:DUF202 domain-containing protein [Corynebacterium sp.]|uniref:DUF202 domain-containing protein n=1 Tax=Corynebacterium sp. TaxID=1720 RepID=UPI0028AFFCDA|nr:DUF202 domain-containing protein [Corynebacterium sp.]